MNELKGLLSTKGEMGRLEFLGYIGCQFALWMMGVVLISSVPEGSIASTPLWTLVIAFWITAVWLNIVATLRRLSNIGWSRWLYVVKLFPGAGAIFELVLLFMPPKISEYKRWTNSISKG